MAKSIMVQGTSSGAGKTTIVTALCRIFKQAGYKAAPFKSQNMTENTVRTASGGEIAVSQSLQAYAAGAEPAVDMNPVVLKPSPDGRGTQIILSGHPYDIVSAGDIGHIKKTTLLPEIMRAYTALNESYDIIVIEGAGSPVELNLNKDDIVNMGIATRVGAPVLLVADIDRGGVFSSLYGTLGLFDETERGYVKASVINRFRGDLSHFTDGVGIIERITGLPVAGVVPYMRFDLPEEDSFSVRVERRVESGKMREERGEFAAASSLSDSPAPDAEFGFRIAGYDGEFDLIADNVRRALDMDLIYRIVNEGVSRG